MNRILILALAYITCLASFTFSQSSPPWENIDWESVEPNLTPIDIQADNEPQAAGLALFSQSLNASALTDEEFTALAQALNNEPVQIFNYVRNQIDYEHYYGTRKGAKLTLMEGSGNDLDQCLLLAELLKAAGVPESDLQVRRGRHRIALSGHGGTNAMAMLGLAEEPFPGKTFLEAYGIPKPPDASHLSDLQAKQMNVALNFVKSRGTPGSGLWPEPESPELSFFRFWLKVTIAGNPFELDPALKEYEKVDGLSDILANVNYSRAGLLTAAGGTTGSGYFEKLQTTSIESFLTSLNTDLVAWLTNNHAGLKVEEVLSGRRMLRRNITHLSEAFPMTEVFPQGTGVINRYNDTNVTGSLSSYQSKIKFKSGALDFTLPTSELAGRKVTLTFGDDPLNGLAELRFDDMLPPVAPDQVPSRTDVGATMDLTITITHPGGLIGEHPETKRYKRNVGFAYAIIYGFKPSGKLLQQRYTVLQEYLDSPDYDDDSLEVRSELLNIMGLTWLYQVELSSRFLAAQNDMLVMNHHRFGRMAQEEGYYVDVGLHRYGNYPSDGEYVQAHEDNTFHLGLLYASALEHGIIEQMQPGASAVSTVNIIRSANGDGTSGSGQRIYLVDENNWGSVESLLHSGGYPGATLTDFGKYYDSSDPNYRPETKLLLPQGFSVTPKLPDGITDGNWTGSGWVIRNRVEAGMIISGDYGGGYSYWPPNTGNHFVSSPPISTSSFYNPSYTYSAPSIPSLKPLPSLPTLPKMYGSDPVDMATGAFIYANVDLETGTEGSPRGLSFSRHYSSISRTRDSQNLGFGWTHPMHIRASVRTAIEESLGLGSIQHAAALLTGTLVASDLYRDDASAKEWGVAALTVGWFVDQMTDNGVSIVIGPDTFQFIKMPDGSYEPPAGSTMELTEVGGNFHLKQRLGNTLIFEDTEAPGDDGKRIDKIVDVDNKEMTFEYHGDDRLNYVEDEYDRRYTFGYDSEERIESITDSTGRSIGFHYDAEGNLDRYEDPEDKFTYYVYEASTDSDGALPVDDSGTEAAEHLMVRMRNHDKEIITQNVWDNLGRVKEQYLHGDTAKTWKLRYTGVANFEEDPEGGVTTYFYDERGRPAGIMDASHQPVRDDPATELINEEDPGKRSFISYDGQDQVVERISPTGEVTKFQYDADHNLERIDYPRGGGATVNTYDALHRLDTTTDPENNLTDLVYFSSGFNAGKNRPQQIIDPKGTTTFTYHETGAAAGMVKTITDDDGLVTENGYDTYSQPDWTEAPGDFRTEFEYTARGDLDWVEDPNGIRTDFTHNKRRQVTKIVTDKDGDDEATEERTYDNQGRLKTVEAPEDNDGIRVKQSYTYSPTDLIDSESLVNETAATTDDLVIDYVYDGRDWVDAIIDAASRQTDVVYFANGEVDDVQRPASRTSSFTYDSDNRVLSQTNPGAPTDRVHGFAYGETLNADGDTTEGYPRSIFTDADSLTTTTEYNRLGQSRFYRNKAEDVFEFRYDGLGRRTHAITPLDAANTRATLTTYYHRGEVDTITEPSGQTATFGYNGTTGRLESATYADGVTSEVVNYTAYDNNGNLEALNEGADTISRTYDNLNRVKSYTDINGNTIGYRYCDSGKIAKIIYPGGTESGVGHVEYTYWKTGRLKEVIDKLDSVSSPRITTNYWNNDGRLDRIERPNGTVRRIKYDLAGRPEIVEEFTSSGQLITLHKNKYFPSDELEWVYQLPKAQTIGAKPNAVNAMLYNIDNQLMSFEGQLVASDPDGNMTNGPLPDGSFGAYDFDIRNRLESAGGISYEYDPEGERVEKSDGTTSTTYVNENNLGLTKVLQRDKDGEVTRYVWGVGLLYEVNESAEATYYHYDNYGSTTALTDDAETVTDRVEYSPFGSIIFREGDHDTPFLFTGFFGNQTDENGLIHMRARFYNPLIRRFVNADPAQQGCNWYAYAAGNPLGFVDPTGLGNASILDAVQTGLSFLGMTPVVGFVADVANAGISVSRGNYADASINLVAAIPGIGQAATGAKFAAAGFGVFGAIRIADRIGDVGRSASNLSTSTKVFQGMEVRAVRNLGHVDDSTLRAMSNHGFAPKTINGDKLVLHHHRQNPSGFIVEVPASNHSIGNLRQHPFGNQLGSGLTAGQRSSFNQWRVNYWKSRATEELSRRTP